jgi:hypothetical protein
MKTYRLLVSGIRCSRHQGLCGLLSLLLATLVVEHATAEIVSIADASVTITASGGPEPESTSVTSVPGELTTIEVGWRRQAGAWSGVMYPGGGDFFERTSAALSIFGSFHTESGDYTHVWSGWAACSVQTTGASMVYSPYDALSPFPDMAIADAYIFKVGDVFVTGGGSYFHHVDNAFDKSPVYSYSFQLDFEVQSIEGLSRVFMTTYGAPTPSEESVVYDSGPLGDASSAPISWQEDHGSSHGGSHSQYGIYAVVPVPEPSTYAMALAGLACGGYSMWRRRKQA